MFPGWGLFVCMLSMLAGSAVEAVRLGLFKQGHVLTDDKNAIVDMSVFWQIPQYILVGLSEVREVRGWGHMHLLVSGRLGSGLCVPQRRNLG